MGHDGNEHVGPLSRRLQTLLDVVADISLCQQRNVSATMARLMNDNGTLETRLYIVFNHEDDESARHCPEYLRLPSIFKMLRQVPYEPSTMDGSPKVIPEDLENDLIKICRTIHNYSFNIFARRVNKRKYRLLDIQGYIEQDREHFTSQQRFTLADFLGHYQDRRQRGGHETSFHHQHRNIYSYWTEHNILPKDALAKNKITLLDAADTLLAAGASSDT